MSDLVALVVYGGLMLAIVIAVIGLVRSDGWERECRHTFRNTTFKDIHTGGGQASGLYVRAYINCRDCDWKTCVAVELPESLDFHRAWEAGQQLDLNTYFDEVRSGAYR